MILENQEKTASNISSGNGTSAEGKCTKELESSTTSSKSAHSGNYLVVLD